MLWLVGREVDGCDGVFYFVLVEGTFGCYIGHYELYMCVGLGREYDSN